MTRRHSGRKAENLASGLERFLFADLMAMMMLAVVAFGTVEPWSLLIFQLNALLAAVALAVWQLIDSGFDWRRLRFSLPLWLLLGLALLQLLPLGGSPGLAGGDAGETLPPELRIPPLPTISADPQATREAAVKLLSLAICFTVALLTTRTTARRRLAMRLLSAFGLAISILAIVQRLTWNGRLYWFRTVSPNVAPFGPYGNYNHFAGLIELLFPLALARLLLGRCEAEERVFLAFATIMMIVAGIFSLSRGGMLAITLQLLLFGLLLAIGRRRWDPSPLTMRSLLTPVLVLAVVLVLTLWIGYEPLLRRLGTTAQGDAERSLVTRVDYWRSAWQIFRDHPVAGVGLGAFPAVYPRYGSSSARHERLEQAHNDYLQLLTDTGLLGGAVALTALALLIRQLRRQWRHVERLRSDDRAALAAAAIAIAGILLHSFVDFNLQIAANALLFSFVVSLAIAPADDDQ